MNRFEIAQTHQARTRRREIALLINLVQPDPENQPVFIGDHTCLSDCTTVDRETMLTRLKHYFGDSFNLNLDASLPELVDNIKHDFPGWPERSPQAS